MSKFLSYGQILDIKVSKWPSLPNLKDHFQMITSTLKNLYQLSYNKLEKGKDCSRSYDKGIVIDPLIKDSFLEVGRRSPWVCVMMCHGNSHDVKVKNPLISNLRISKTISNVYITLSEDLNKGTNYN